MVGKPEFYFYFLFLSYAVLLAIFPQLTQQAVHSRAFALPARKAHSKSGVPCTSPERLPAIATARARACWTSAARISFLEQPRRRSGRQYQRWSNITVGGVGGDLLNLSLPDMKRFKVRAGPLHEPSRHEYLQNKIKIRSSHDEPNPISLCDGYRCLELVPEWFHAFPALGSCPNTISPSQTSPFTMCRVSEARLITRPPVPRDRSTFSSHKSNDAQSQPLKRYLVRERDRLGGS